MESVEHIDVRNVHFINTMNGARIKTWQVQWRLAQNETETYGLFSYYQQAETLNFWRVWLFPRAGWERLREIHLLHQHKLHQRGKSSDHRPVLRRPRRRPKRGMYIVCMMSVCQVTQKHTSNLSFVYLQGAVALSNITYTNLKGTSSRKTAVDFDCSDSGSCRDISVSSVLITASDGRGTEARCRNAQGKTSGYVYPRIPCLS
jgi:hypothetical protein